MTVGEAVGYGGAAVAAVTTLVALWQSKKKDDISALAGAADRTRAAETQFVDNLQEDNAALRAHVKQLEDRFEERLTRNEARFEERLARTEARCEEKLKVCVDRMDVMSKDYDQVKLELFRMRRKYGENGD